MIAEAESKCVRARKEARRSEVGMVFIRNSLVVDMSGTSDAPAFGTKQKALDAPCDWHEYEACLILLIRIPDSTD